MIEVTTYHILRHGQPLCGFMPGAVPKDWPENHRWVRQEHLDKATCLRCIAVNTQQPMPPLEVLSEERKAELDRMIEEMQIAANAFYIMARDTNCHPFVEFCGFMNEYIKICKDALAEGVDFSFSTEHSGLPIPIKEHQGKYIAEKFGCIFGPAMRANPRVWRIFCDQVLAA